MAVMGDVTAVVMGKLPAAGRVKTRLVPPLTHEQAADVHGLFLRHTLERLCKARTELDLRGVVFCFDPPDAGDAARRKYADLGVTLLPQRPGDLGARLTQAHDQLGRPPTLFLGADSPDLPAAYLWAAVASLREDWGAVLGPCDDGGFWCLGAPSGWDLGPVLSGVEWSSGRELAQVRQGCARNGLATADAPEWSDVDRPADLATLAHRLRRDADPAAARLLRLLTNALPGELLTAENAP